MSRIVVVCIILFVTDISFRYGSTYEHHLKGPSFHVEPPTKVEFSNTSGCWIDCTAFGNPSPSMDWTLADGSAVEDVVGVRKVFKNGTLVMLPFDAAAYRQDVHNAVYRCAASNAVGKIVSRDVQVRAVVAQAYKVSVEVLSASRGCTAILKCVVPSFVKDLVKVVSWVQDPATYFYPKLQSDSKYHVLPSGELLIYDLQLNDQYPQYRCRTMHRLTRQVVGSPSVTIRISEHRGVVSPTIIEHTRTVQVEQDEGIVMLCIAQSCPSPDYRWYSLSGPEPILITPGPRTHLLGPVLALEAVTHKDAGVYRCSASNVGGEASAESRLVVVTPFHVEVTPSVLSVHIGGTAEFRCTIHSEGQYNKFHMISWLKDGMPVPGMGRHNGDRFVLRGVTRDDRGMYQCVVRRAEGDTAQSSAELQLGDTPPTLLYSFIEQTLQPGPFVSLKCSAAGNPTPQITWTLDGFHLPNNGRFVIGQYMTVHGDVISHVNISQVAVEDGGEYTCTAANRAGKVSHSARLNVYGHPYIRLIPKITAIAGETLRLKCPVAGYPIEEIHWEQGGKTLPTEIRQNVELDGTLVIRSVQKDVDFGVYSCWAKNKQGKSARRSAEIEVIVPPKLSSSPDRVLNAGERASLTCSAIKGDLPMSMAWLKDGRAVDGQSVTITQLDQYNSILLIESLSQEHHGNYSCFARNAAAEVSITTQLFVNVPPIIEPFSFQNGLSEGMRTRTVCGVSQGDPPLTITWLKDGGSLPPHLGANYTTLDAYSSLLSIPSLTSSHSGDYTCVASNPAAELRYTAKLQVKVPPRWTVEPSNMVSVERNRHVMLHCQAEGVPKPTISWKKASGGKTGDYEDVREKMHTKVFANGSLLLQNVKEDKEGLYMCEASNGIGNPIGKMVQLNVNSSPYFSSPSNQVTVKKGDTAVLKCHVNGDKPLTVIWIKNGNVELTPQTNYRVFLKQDPSPEGIIAEIRISEVETEDGGTYFCQASNMFGREQQLIKLSVQEPPQSPSNLEIVSAGSRSINLQWKRPPEINTEISRYIVQYKDEDAGGNWHNVEVGDVTSVTIDDLKPDTRYAFRIMAEGMTGRSSPSSSLLVKTDPQRPAGPPLHINVRPVSSTEILLTWAPPLAELRHGKILGYNVGVKEASSSASSFTFTNVSGEEEEGGELLLTGLLKFTRYSIVIRSFNQVGPGPLSEPILTQTLEDVPSLPPYDVRCSPLSPESVQINWQPPPPSHCNGILQGYKVHVEPLHDEVWYHSENLEPRTTTSLTMVVSGLRKFTNYSIQVLAFTRVGDGIMTKPIYCLTEEDVPGPPADIKIVVKSPQSLLVSWLPPKEPNGIITKYNLYMRTSNPSTVESQNKHYLPTKHTYYEVKNLKQQIEYQFYVTASTKIGEGQSSKTVSLTPSKKVPARIASFGGTVVFPWQSVATLSCYAVGQPEPRREWFKDDQPLKTGIGQRYQILESGDLVLPNLQESDSANYSCQVDNFQSSDRVVYSLTVQVPPSAPVLYVTSATSNSILFHWKAGSSGGAIITGFILHFRKGHSDPEEILLPRRISLYELKNLSCGSTYDLFLIAQNKIGKSLQSPKLTVRTQGEVPGVPQGTTLIQPNSTSVLLRLHVWPDGGCPLLYFVIHYKANEDNPWILVSNSLKPQKKFVISNLQPSTVYQLKIEAHNIAGSSMAEFTFITLTKDGDPPPPELVTRNHRSQALLTDLRIVIPLFLTVVALFGVLTAAIFCWRSKFTAERERSLKKNMDAQRNCTSDRDRYYTNIHNSIIEANSEKIPETSEDISPYATFQLSQADPQTNTMLHSFMYHERSLTKSCDSPPLPTLRISSKRRSRSRKREAESEGSDSDVDQLTSGRNESSGQINVPKIKQGYVYHGAHSSTSSDVSPISESKSLSRKTRNSHNRWLETSKGSLRSLLPTQFSTIDQTSINDLPLELLTQDKANANTVEGDTDTIKKPKPGPKSSQWSHPTGRTNHQIDYSIAV